VNEKHQQLLKTAAKVIIAQQKQIDYMVEELAKANHAKSASKLASSLIAQGVGTQEEAAELAEKIAKIGNLSAVKQALELLPRPKKDLPIGSVEKVAEDKTAEHKLMEDPAVEFLMSKAGIA
jgi:hypothetical protein